MARNQMPSHAALHDFFVFFLFVFGFSDGTAGPAIYDLFVGEALITCSPADRL